MLNFLKNFFLKPLKINFLSILLVIISVYLSSLSDNKYFILYLIAIRFAALILDYITKDKDAGKSEL